MDQLEFAIEQIKGEKFERVANAFLRKKEFTVDESGIGQGLNDGGRDSKIEKDGKHGIAHISTETEWEDKIEKDAKKTKKLQEGDGKEYEIFVFVTSQRISGKKEQKTIEEIRDNYNLDTSIYHRDNILGEIRDNSPEIAEEYLGVGSAKSKQSYLPKENMDIEIDTVKVKTTDQITLEYESLVFVEGGEWTNDIAFSEEWAVALNVINDDNHEIIKKSNIVSVKSSEIGPTKTQINEGEYVYIDTQSDSTERWEEFQKNRAELLPAGTYARIALWHLGWDDPDWADDYLSSPTE